jgi:uncharacterized repeat protein (TIGR03803 family)
MRPKVHGKSRFAPDVLSAIAGLLLAGALGTNAEAALKKLHNFAPCGGDVCRDGSAPVGGLVRDASGNYFGTTYEGGAHAAGTVFELSPDGNGGYTYKTIYDFCAEANCEDGANPHSTMIIDVNGALYGTTHAGGEGGVAFRLSPTANGWELVTIHRFCELDSPTPDGDCMGGSNAVGGVTYAGAASGAPYDGVSPLYGASAEGGEGEAGIIYELRPPRNLAKEEWRAKELYVFCAPAGAARERKARPGPHEEDGNCDDGKMPSGNLIVNGNGDLFGTTYYGGEDAYFPGGGGVVFELSKRGTAWTETVLYKFCSVAKCRDGRSPAGGLLIDATGNLFGAAQYGGKSCGMQQNCGVAFTISPNGAQSVSRVLHDFCTADGCADGALPQGALEMDSFGNLYGAAFVGGANKGGVIYQLRTDGQLKVLHSFCAEAKCADGQSPASVILDETGNLFGVATGGGNKGGGTVFKLTR